MKDKGPAPNISSPHSFSTDAPSPHRLDETKRDFHSGEQRACAQPRPGQLLPESGSREGDQLL